MARRPRDPVVLTDGERTTLTAWTRSRHCPQALVLRARIVLACEQEVTNTAVAERVGTSVDTVRTWRSRFLAEGLDGLAERPRPGRPPVVTDDTVTQAIVGTLDPPPTGRRWSTRAMAEAVGLSQTKVSQIWRTYRIRSNPNNVPQHAGSSPLLQVRDLVGLHIAPPLRVLAVAAEVHAAPVNVDSPASPTTSKRSAAARDLFAVANAFASIKGDYAGETPGSALRDFLDHLHRSVPAGVAVHLIVAGLDTLSHQSLDLWLREHPRFHVHEAAPSPAWIDDIDILLSRSPLSHDSVLGFATSIDELREDVRGWLNTWTPSTQPFSWIKSRRSLWSTQDEVRGTKNSKSGKNLEAPSVEAEESEASQGAAGSPRIADKVAHLVREALANGQFKPGERVKEAPLATRLEVSRGPVREALRVLAEEGMLELLPNRGAAVPQISATNILDLYAVRAYLGGLLMRRVATLPRSALRPVSTALAEVRVVAGHGDHPRIGEADLLFQDAIARTAQLPQAGRTFEHLTMRLRMFNAILQLDWAEAVDLIARENIGLYEAIRSGDADEAARRWRIKVERSVRYMVAQLPQDHFDPALWSTIAGRPVPDFMR